MKKYPKDFIIFLANWLYQKNTNKEYLKKYEHIIKEESIKMNNTYRIWSFESKEMNQLIRNNEIDLKDSYFESHFEDIDHIGGKDVKYKNFELTKRISETITMYLYEFKVLTKKENHSYFNIYNPIKYVLENKRLLKEYDDKEINKLSKIIDKYEEEKERLLINPSNKIKAKEVQYVMIQKDYLKSSFKWNEYDKGMEMIKSLMEKDEENHEENYYIFNLENFKTLVSHYNLITYDMNEHMNKYENKEISIPDTIDEIISLD